MHDEIVHSPPTPYWQVALARRVTSYIIGPDVVIEGGYWVRIVGHER
jgi:hypothetical protein